MTEQNWTKRVHYPTDAEKKEKVMALLSELSAELDSNKNSLGALATARLLNNEFFNNIELTGNYVKTGIIPEAQYGSLLLAVAEQVETVIDKLKIADASPPKYHEKIVALSTLAEQAKAMRDDFAQINRAEFTHST